MHVYAYSPVCGHVCVYLFTCVWACMCMHIHMSVGIHVYTCSHVCGHVCICMITCVWVCMCMHVHMCVGMCTSMYRYKWRSEVDVSCLSPVIRTVFTLHTMAKFLSWSWNLPFRAGLTSQLAQGSPVPVYLQCTGLRVFGLPCPPSLYTDSVVLDFWPSYWWRNNFHSLCTVPAVHLPKF